MHKWKNCNKTEDLNCTGLSDIPAAFFNHFEGITQPNTKRCKKMYPQ